MKILIVDDTLVVRKMQMNTLQKMGFTQLLEAKNGIEAIRTAESNPDLGLILLDWNMPAMNGITALKSLKLNPKTQKIPVVMVTAEKNKSKVLEAVKNGASGYITIPFIEKEFKLKIQTILEKCTALA